MLEANHAICVSGHAVEARLREAVTAERLERKPAATLAQRGLAAGVITQAELETLAAAEKARAEVVVVNAFRAAKRARMSA